MRHSADQAAPVKGRFSFFILYIFFFFYCIEAVQQFKVGLKESANRGLNPQKRITLRSNAIVEQPIYYEKNH
jgi:hypothetical protein